MKEAFYSKITKCSIFGGMTSLSGIWLDDVTSCGDVIGWFGGRADNMSPDVLSPALKKERKSRKVAASVQCRCDPGPV